MALPLRLALAEFCHLGSGRDEEGMTPPPGNSGRRTGRIRFQSGGRGRVRAVQRDTTQTPFSEWHVSKHTRGRSTFVLNLIHASELPGRFGVGAAFQSECVTNAGPLSGAEGLRNPRRWVARPSSGCRQMCLKAKSRGLLRSYCTQAVARCQGVWHIAE